MKNFLLFISIICCVSAQAQFDIYEHDFSTDGTEGWTLVDNDASGITWALQNNDYNTIFGDGGAFNVLQIANSEMVSPPKSNWAIMPQQDMSFYTGAKLNFSYRKGVLACEVNDIVKIYAGLTANVEEMLAAGPIATVTLEGDNITMPPVAVEKIVDIPTEWNVAGVYFAIVHGRNVGETVAANWTVELTEVSLSAEGLAGIGQVAKNTTIIKQNPVTEHLQLQLGSNVNADALNVAIYNISGMLVKTAKYSEAGIQVSDLAGGMYFAVLNDGNATEQLKFIKK